MQLPKIKPKTIIAGICQWRIVLANAEGFQISVSVLATEVRGRLNGPNLEFLNSN